MWARVFKDLYPRFQTMRGHAVPRKGGWDCHGLPVELEVEKELGLHSKHEIEAYGVAAFNQHCRDSVFRYVEDWSALTTRSGTWIDTEDAYWTLSNEYVESVWWLLSQLWEKGLLYEGHKVSPYCSRCGTALSSHELGQPDVYRDIVDPSVYVRFPIVDDPERRPDLVGADLLVWTTTPWTLISNVAAAVGPDIEYARVPAEAFGSTGRDLVVAVAQLPDGAEPIATWKGHELVGAHYERPFDLLPVPGGSDAWRVVAADYVSTDDGTGIVHQAPAFGEEDAAVARAEGLPMLNPVEADGTFDHTVPAWQGLFVKDADRGIIADLAERGLLVRELAYTHSYPHCWRCDTPLIYWAKTSWFVRTSTRRDEMLRENETINWQPDHIKHGRFGKWLEGNVDWALSRDRYWGTPLPIWRCRGCGHEHCVGSVSELSELAGRDLTELDLHRPYVDEVTIDLRRVRGHRPTRRTRARRMVRLGVHAVGPVPLPLRRRRPVPPLLPRRLHLRGDRPDPRLVLLAAGGQHPRVRPQPLPQRGVPQPDRRRERSEDVQVQGQHHRPVGHLLDPGSRRPAVVLLLVGPAVDAAPRLPERHPRVDPPDAAHPLERLLVLRHLRRPRRMVAG